MTTFPARLKMLAGAWNDHWFATEPAIGLALFRVAFGASVALFHVPRVPFITDLYTPAGFMAPMGPASWLPLIQPLPFPAAYALHIFLFAAITALILGYWTRTAAATVFAVHTYLMLLERFSADGAAQIIAIFSLLLACSPAGGYLSLDALRAHGSAAPTPIPRLPDTLRRVMVWQVAIIYISNAMLKVASGFTPWITGNAMVWLLSDTVWSQPWARQAAIRFPGPLRGLTAVAFVSFLFLGVGLLWRKTRPYAMVFGLSWHLVAFALTILSPAWLVIVSAYVLLVEPATWERYWIRFRRGRLQATELAMATGIVLAFALAAMYGRTRF